MGRKSTPIELRKASGIRKRKNLAEIPAGFKAEIPTAEWAAEPSKFDRALFVRETEEFLGRVYGIRTGYETLVWMLACEMETYAQAMAAFDASGRELIVNGRPSVWLKIRDGSMKAILQIQRELGLSPTSRLEATGTPEPDSKIAEFLAFPKLIRQQDIEQ